MTAVRLHHRSYGEGQPKALPALLIHGLFGSAANWHGIARRLAGGRLVLVPDLRNHGESPWDARMDYPAMALDLAALLDHLGLERVHLVGHSMGGKAAMWLALSQPERVGSLVVADIAPVTYPSRHGVLVNALAALPLGEIEDRRAADARLAVTIHSAAVRGYLLQNLVHGRAKNEDGIHWRWRINLAVLARCMDQILGFPPAAGRAFPGPAQFIYGSRSDYVTGAGLPHIRELFPLSRLRTIANAGHWVYADQPEAFVAALSGFLKD
ncbi:MAG TPA: alpha/beta fold hydrolase [Lamprocystis sp. (in: g-proteobacteria)]|nr:alpha/beta fold hydrolase [Lamprocystis sp. (in: g-proteobacteria)]